MGSGGAIVEVSQFVGYNYAGHYPTGHFFSYFAHPLVPIVSVLLYFTLSTPVFQWFVKTFNINPKGRLLQNFVILHSFLLAVYSAWTFVNSWYIVGRHISGKITRSSLLICGILIILPFIYHRPRILADCVLSEGVIMGAVWS